MSVDAPGTVIAGRYELIAPAGQGGMAVVWRALTRGAAGFRRPVAIKRILNEKHQDASFLAMFVEEARVGAQLQHPNIVQTEDFGKDEHERYYLVMEWVEGLDMSRWMLGYQRARVPPPWPLVTAVAVEALRGLSAAHERVDALGQKMPIFHRDISPSNILVGDRGAVKLSDFGLARAMDRASMTRPDIVKGKVAFCAPELIAGAKPSAMSDLFSLGVVLWEALAQRRLFTGKTDMDVLMAVARGQIQPLGDLRPDLPPALTEAVHRALARNPAERFDSALDMARSLGALLRQHPEPTDAEAIVASVQWARAQLASQRPAAPPAPPMPTKAGAPVPAEPPSFGDVEVDASSLHLSIEVVTGSLSPSPPAERETRPGRPNALAARPDEEERAVLEVEEPIVVEFWFVEGRVSAASELPTKLSESAFEPPERKPR